MKEAKEVRLSVRVTPEFLERLKETSSRKGILMSALVINALTTALDDMDSEHPENHVVDRDELINLKKRIETLEELVMREVA